MKKDKKQCRKCRQPGYTSFQGAWLWNRTLKNYKPDVVLIGFVVQDARKAAYSDKSQAILQKDYRFLKENFLYNSRSYLALRAAIGSVQIRAKERGTGDVGGVYRVPPEDYVHNLRTLISQACENGGTPFFGYPLSVRDIRSSIESFCAAAQELDVLLFDPQKWKKRFETVIFFTRSRCANAAGNDLMHCFCILQEQNLLGTSNGTR